MELKYTLTENDYLQQQLYMASKSRLVNNQRKKSRILVFIVLLGISLLFYMIGNTLIAYYLAGYGVICFFLYPIYLKFYYQSEIKDYFFIALKTGVSIMIPKSEIIDVEAVRTELKMIAEKIGINFISELNWKWK